MEEYKIGKNYKGPIVIDEKSASVSHDHASIMIDGDVWVIQDNGSKNGTFVEEDGEFRQCSKLRITPGTWIRLGEKGIRGHYFKARRVKRPNDFSEDFIELSNDYEELRQAKLQLETMQRNSRFIGLFLMVVGLCLSLLPFIQGNPIGVRACFFIPGALSPFIQDIILSKYKKRIIQLKGRIICPRCRRPLSEYDINRRSCSVCKAY